MLWGCGAVDRWKRFGFYVFVCLEKNETEAPKGRGIGCFFLVVGEFLFFKDGSGDSGVLVTDKSSVCVCF